VTGALVTVDLVRRFGYLGIILLLVLGGLGLPVPEEAPVILAAVLSRRGTMWVPLAFASSFIGVLLGDFVVYFLGYAYGEKVLSFRLTQKLLTKPREAQIKGYFHRHGIKILILGRFAVGFRTAAYLTAGILRLPPLNLLIADLVAATLSTSLMFGLGYFFADWIESGIREAKHYIVPAAGALIGVWLLYRYYSARRRAGMPVGPPVPVTDHVPLPPDDLRKSHSEFTPVAELDGSHAAQKDIAPGAEPAKSDGLHKSHDQSASAAEAETQPSPEPMNGADSIAPTESPSASGFHQTPA
jgi:membrane protein DedA with SNARE-associated domain